jgi:hypothetical protein
MNFSFFRRVRGAGGVTRGKQIAERLGGRVDPADGYEDDVCIYILGCYREDAPEVKRAYYDVMDCGGARLSRVIGRTKGHIIAVSKAQWAEFCKLPRAIYFIPHHHCNYEREQRPADRPVRRIGCCGGDSAVQWPHDRMKVWAESIGLEWVFTNEYLRRERVVDFYKELDIQIVFRPTHSRGIPAHTNPVKLSNAGSFGIPTVAFPEVAYTPEWGSESVVYADNMGAVMREVKRLKDDPVWYAEMAEAARMKAEQYHIDNIVPLYRELDNG